MTPTPVLSVVLPTYNRRERLHKVLQSLADQDLDEAFEVVVVSDGSSDGTDDDLRSGATPIPVLARFQDNQGPASARNLGVEMARGDIVLFIDDDVVADRALLRRHLDAHRRLGDKTVVIGPMLNAPDFPYSAWVAWEQVKLAEQYQAMNAGQYTATSRQFYTGNASVRREHVMKAGGFDTRFRRGEDIELAFRLEDQGLAFEFVPEAIGLHHAERSFDSWVAAARAYGRHDVVFTRELGEGSSTWGVGEKYRRQNIAVETVAARRTERAASETRLAVGADQRRPPHRQAHPDDQRRIERHLCDRVFLGGRRRTRFHDAAVADRPRDVGVLRECRVADDRPTGQPG